jgi:hypothetical protein
MAITGTRLACALSECKAMTVATVAPVLTGAMALIEDVVGFYFTGGKEVAFIYAAPKAILPCVTVATGAFVAGSKVYFDATAKKVTEVSTGNKLCGFVLETPAVGDKEVLVDLDGTLGIVS